MVVEEVQYYCWSSTVVRVVDRHRFDADADPYSTSILMPNPDPGPVPFLSFTHVGKSGFFWLFTAVPVYSTLFRQRNTFHNWQYILRYFEIFWKKSSLALHLVENGYGSGSISAGSGFRFRSAKMMPIQPNLGPHPDPQH
jgi:hypothetical protein